MKILNSTRGHLLADSAREAKRLAERMKGLLGSDELTEGQGLVIRPCTSIHSFFMRFVFDAMFFDRDGCVLHLIHSMKPWRLSRIVWKAAGVVELPAGVLQASKTARGDKLVFAEA